MKGWRGQKQVWFALRFEGQDSEVDLNAHLPPEFDAWRWAGPEEALDLVVPFKREAYEQVIAAFARFAVPAAYHPAPVDQLAGQAVSRRAWRNGDSIRFVAERLREVKIGASLLLKHSAGGCRRETMMKP